MFGTWSGQTIRWYVYSSFVVAAAADDDAVYTISIGVSGHREIAKLSHSLNVIAALWLESGKSK